MAPNKQVTKVKAFNKGQYHIKYTILVIKKYNIYLKMVTLQSQAKDLG